MVSGNTSLLYIDKEKLHSKYLCNKHFTNDSFVDPVMKRRLYPTATPHRFEMENPETPSTSKPVIKSDKKHETNTIGRITETYSKKQTVPFQGCSLLESTNFSSSSDDSYGKQFLKDITNMPSPQKRSNVKNIVMTVASKKVTKKLKNKNAQISKLKAKIKNLKENCSIHNILKKFDFQSDFSKAIVTMQFLTKKRKWTSEEKEFALMFFYKSPTTYRFFREQNIVLPGISTVRRWIGNSSYKPGLCDTFLGQIRKKFQDKSRIERTAVLCFDELSIMECLEYSKKLDLVEGYEDLGNGERSNLTAKFALVFMLRGLYMSWKIPVAYYLTHTGIKGLDLANLIVEIIKKLIEVNIVVKVCVCDQGSNNRSAYSILGVTTQEPFFIINKEKIMALHDVPHLFKNIRNNLQDSDFEIENKIISFKDIVKVYNIDKNNIKCRALPKLTEAHVFTKFGQKMSVKLALQVMSHSVAAAIKTCIGTGQLNSETAKHTAEFIEFIDQLFDCLNSKTLFSRNPYNAAMSHANFYVLTTLNKAEDIFSHITKINKSTNSKTRPFCFDGLVQTISGVKMLFENEVDGQEIHFLLTNRLNQDVLENLFSVYRQKGGYNRNPTVRTLRTIFRTNALNSLMKTSSSANCEPDLCSTVDISSTVDSSKSDEEQDQDQSSSSQSEENTEQKSLEDCSVTYFAGYLGYICVKKFHCNLCQEYFLSNIDLNDEDQLLIINKMYENITSGGLLAPTKQFRNIVNESLRIFERYYGKLFFCNKLSKKLENKIIKKIHEIDNHWLEHEICSTHRKFIIHHLIVCKLHKKCKWSSKKTIVNINNPKLRILKHL